jgi:putative Ca2+/H+ antiporter (TMEM165/GDT1 family)
VEAVVVALVAVFVAELGDKSQLVALTFATRNPWVPVLAGIAVAVAVLQAMAVGVGAVLREALPQRPVELVGAGLFLVAAVWTLRDVDDDDEEAVRAVTSRSVALAAGSAFFLAELGDKTQLATLALATANGPVPTWIGATVGEVLADALAIGVGVRLGARLPERPLRLASAAAFAVFGMLLLARVL